MENSALESILNDWSFWSTSPPGGVIRKIPLPERLHSDLAVIIQGVRRGGKSTLLTQLPQQYHLPLTHCFYCNFEDPRLMNDLSFHLLEQIVSIARQTYSPDIPCYFFLDEIQNVVGWEKWLHVQLERRSQNYFVLTGSNSCLLSGEFGTALTGRHITIELYPFSYLEYKTLFQERSLQDFLTSGGFPRPLLFEQPYQLLQEYFNDIIYRDVLKRVHTRHPEAIKQVAKMAFDSAGSELSYRKIAAVTGLTVDTVKSYLDACEQAYLLFSCPFFSFSAKQRAIRQKKYYPIDSGLRYAVSNTSHRDLGKSLEIMIFLQLRQKHEQLFYWQEIHQGEVDFVGVSGNNIIPYQVTWNEPLARHEKALTSFYEAYPHAQEVVFITQENAHLFI